MSGYLTANTRQTALDSFRTAAQHATTARQREAAGDHASAIQQWRIVLGDEFPDFG